MTDTTLLLEAAKKARLQLKLWMRDHGQDIASQEAIKAIDNAINSATPEAQGVTDDTLGAAMWRMFEHGKNNLRLCGKEEIRALLSLAPDTAALADLQRRHDELLVHFHLAQHEALQARGMALREAAALAVNWGNARNDDNGGHALRNYAAALLGLQSSPQGQEAEKGGA